ncbi:DUF1801 domain-containing protein [Roseobacter sinensis]|uniref:DUF1801 domain-containing protein n=1 Tax=Roseobacter sinensis TaxID=2931391 RepID=A0ABT3BFR9_9RHOB|nr:DUF1801 domain-containing protein [Roseobacter sp. WL0113]MCV3272430.1 DUF1801 domain-containing protein [Roseobacter sp. WL0113]
MPPLPDDVHSCTLRWPAPARAHFDALREIVYRVADRAGVGALTETLKWGHPAWLPARPRIGSTLRCDWHETMPDRLSLYVHCQTTLVETMRTLYPRAFTYDGSRALHMPLAQPIPGDAVDHCAFLTLTYHRKTA